MTHFRWWMTWMLSCLSAALFADDRDGEGLFLLLMSCVIVAWSTLAEKMAEDNMAKQNE